jgi:hypothetical protein
MMDFQFTLFNSITLFIMAATLWTAYARFRFRPESNWFALYYLVICGYWMGFDGSLNTWWVVGGVACAVLLRAKWTPARVAELVFFGYVLWRGVGLLLLW